MMVTPFTLITTGAVSLAVNALLILYLDRVNYERQFTPKTLVLILLIPLARLFLPMEFWFTQVIRAKEFYPGMIAALTAGRAGLPRATVSGVGICMLVWAAGIGFGVVRDIYRYREFTSSFRLLPSCNDPRLDGIVEAYFDSRGRRRKRVRLVRTAAVREPLIYGVFRTTIVLPKLRLTEQELGAVIRHELSHYCNGDLVLKWVIGIMRSVYWWNPSIYVLAKKIGHAMEMRADYDVVGKQSVDDKVHYLNTLVAICKSRARAGGDTPPGSFNTFTHGGPLVIERRVNAIVEDPGPKVRRRNTIRLLIVILLVMALSYGFVIQPYSTPDMEDFAENQNEILIPQQEGYFVLREDGWYDLYMNGEFVCELEAIREGLEDVPILNRQTEVAY